MTQPDLAACPCGSGRSFADCCGPLLAGAAAPTAEALMRSRYTAHVRGAIDYIVDTHDAATRGTLDRRAIARWARDSDWLGLDILAVDEAAGVVEFAARYRLAADGREQRHHERSRFVRAGGRWFYRDGVHIAPPVATRAVTVGRNDPCSCGSGKKYKKCCG